MSTIAPPTERECLRCGRIETWDEDRTSWVAATVDGETRRGRPHCVHEWDITGNYNPTGVQ
ncbi:hypothetical protein SAMN05216226_104171 [Halovenus aranensis]|jgi:hypothetical protein|uniref:HEWD domain-containing protein n=1 Tax=Halovenus aranensis TaxID=890420 RepID=A0A1G8UED4_9EURY|nr:HEWD family protein [Halovenus aranensis]SDJ51370.1 hypothetical protein SAMN05216226_104171 [Halovenus aranensis]